jgi:hypothetical protein
MHLLSWFILGLAINAICIASIIRTVSTVSVYRSMKSFWSGYMFRYVLIGLGLLLAVQWGVQQSLAVFLGLITLRIALLFSGYTRFINGAG